MDAIDRSWGQLIGDRVRLRELRILHAVARCGSMAKAATALGMTQPAISQAIGLLEAALGVPMLERGPAGVTLTGFGDIMLRRALDAMDALSDGLRDIEALADPAGGQVIVGASESYIAGGGLARTILALGRRYPRMRVHIVESNTAAMDFVDLRERRVDVMLGRVARGPLPDDLRQDVLLAEQLLVVTGGQNAWVHRRAMTFADLADKAWVLAPPGSAVHELVAAAFRATGAAMPAVAITTYSMVLRLQLLSAGDYVTAFPASLVQENAARWNLRVLPLELGEALPVAAFTLTSRAQDRALQAFLAMARHHAGSGASGPKTDGSIAPRPSRARIRGAKP